MRSLRAGGRCSTASVCCIRTPLIEIVSGAYRDLRIFAGYAGWASGQLQAEISEGMWHVMPADYDDVFGGQPPGCGVRCCRRQRGEVAFFSTWMENPELNELICHGQSGATPAKTHHPNTVKLVFRVHRITSQESPSEKVIVGVLTETSVFISH